MERTLWTNYREFGIFKTENNLPEGNSSRPDGYFHFRSEEKRSNRSRENCIVIRYILDIPEDLGIYLGNTRNLLSYVGEYGLFTVDVMGDDTFLVKVPSEKGALKAFVKGLRKHKIQVFKNDFGVWIQVKQDYRFTAKSTKFIPKPAPRNADRMEIFYYLIREKRWEELYNQFRYEVFISPEMSHYEYEYSTREITFLRKELFKLVFEPVFQAMEKEAKTELEEIKKDWAKATVWRITREMDEYREYVQVIIGLLERKCYFPIMTKHLSSLPKELRKFYLANISLFG